MNSKSRLMVLFRVSLTVLLCGFIASCKSESSYENNGVDPQALDDPSQSPGTGEDQVLVPPVAGEDDEVWRLDSRPCVLILYDEQLTPSSSNFAKMHMVQLKNLLGHFPEYQQFQAMVSDYTEGMIASCEATIYLGSVYGSEIPSVFYQDVTETEKPFMWVGYSFWNLPLEVQKENFGLAYDRLTFLDTESLDQEGDPTFFRFFHYKEEKFYKNLYYQNPEKKEGPNAAFELVATRPIGTDVEVLAWAEHSYSREEIPYITNKNNFFFVADIPFSYIHEADRYLIFADILFDFLQLPAKHDEQVAFIRIEDVHPLTPVKTLEAIQSVFDQEGVPLHISLIPIYAKEQMVNDKLVQERVSLTEQPDFLNWLGQAQAAGTEFLLHGVTHHLDGVKNPLGVSGVDYEFWNIETNQAVTGQSAEKTLSLLETAHQLLASAKIFPKIWLTPHYLASPTDYRIFASVFTWNLGRITYFIDQPKNQPDPSNSDLTQRLQFSRANQGLSAARRQAFENYSNAFTDYKLGQFFPYEIYGDHYGQRVLPESLGNVTSQPVGNGRKRSVDDILADAKRNRVLRDTWASLFFHPFLLNAVKDGGLGEYPNDDRELRRLVRGIKDLGYNFVPIEDFMKNQEDVPHVLSRPWKRQ